MLFDTSILACVTILSVEKIKATTSLGTVVRRLRKRLGFTQRQLAGGAKITRAYLNAIEMGRKDERVSLGTLRSLGDALGVQPYVLIAFDQTRARSGLRAAVGVGVRLGLTSALDDIERLGAGKRLRFEHLPPGERRDFREKVLSILDRAQLQALETGFNAAHRTLYRRAQKGRAVRRNLSRKVTLAWAGHGEREVRIRSRIRPGKR